MAILDAGTGFGQYTYFCAKHFPNANITAAEINPEHVISGNTFFQNLGWNQIRFQETDLTSASFTNQFDLILAIDIMEHIEQDKIVFNLFHQSLKPGGYLVLSTPSLYRKHRKDGEFVDEHYREGYSEAEIQQKLHHARLIKKKIIYTYGFWGDLSWRIGIRNAIKMMGKDTLGKICGSLYLAMMLPFVLILMFFDLNWPNTTGTGLLVVTQKEFKS